MYSLLLVIIYISFIALGLPDSILGAGWPQMHIDLNVELSYAGILTMIIAGATIVSGLMSARLIKLFKTGPLTAISVMLTAVALYFFSVSTSFVSLCIWAIPYGLGAGAVDAALNNYVALNYSGRHMSFLHCFWGLGTIISPYIMSFCLTYNFGWSAGYFSLSVFQLCLAVFIFSTLFVWKKQKSKVETDTEDLSKVLSLMQILKIKGVWQTLVGFFCYCTIESTVILWCASYLVEYCGLNPDFAAKISSLFFIGITLGRFLSGLIADKLGDKKLIFTGIFLVISCIVLLALFSGNIYITIVLLATLGLGCAPIYPSIIHSTPNNFGKENSQSIIGFEISAAYTGSTFMPLAFGFIAGNFSLGFLTPFLLFFAIVMITMFLWQHKILKAG